MFIREIKKPNGSSTIAIVESVRVENKVVQKVIRTFGTHKDATEITIIKQAAEKVVVEMLNATNPVLPGLDPAEFHVKKPDLENPQIKLMSMDLSMLAPFQWE